MIPNEGRLGHSEYCGHFQGDTRAETWSRGFAVSNAAGKWFVRRRPRDWLGRPSFHRRRYSIVSPTVLGYPFCRTDLEGYNRAIRAR